MKKKYISVNKIRQIQSGNIYLFGRMFECSFSIFGDAVPWFWVSNTKSEDEQRTLIDSITKRHWNIDSIKNILKLKGKGDSVFWIIRLIRIAKLSLTTKRGLSITKTAIYSEESANSKNFLSENT